MLGMDVAEHMALFLKDAYICETNQYVALKIHHPTYDPPENIVTEYRLLKVFGGSRNVVELLFDVYDTKRKTVTFVFPFFEETPFFSLVADATEKEVQAYMFKITCRENKWHSRI